MKRIYLVLIALALVIVLALPVSVSAAAPTISVDFNQAQFQWRGTFPYGSGDLISDGWTSIYQNSPESAEFKLSGDTLHTNIWYSPAVTELEGESTQYSFKDDVGLWVEKGGKVSYMYVPGYGDYTVTNYWRGYLDFGEEAPSDDTFVHGVDYQWAYIFEPLSEEEDIEEVAPFAVWDSEVKAWLVGFSIYFYDAGIQTYTTPFPTFPDDFPEPIPASNFNPLDL